MFVVMDIHTFILNQNLSRFCHMLPKYCKLYVKILNQNSSRFYLIDQVNIGVCKSEPKFKQILYTHTWSKHFEPKFEQILSYCTKYLMKIVYSIFISRHFEPIFEQIFVSLIARSARKLVQNVYLDMNTNYI